MRDVGKKLNKFISTKSKNAEKILANFKRVVSTAMNKSQQKKILSSIYRDDDNDKQIILQVECYFQ